MNQKNFYMIKIFTILKDLNSIALFLLKAIEKNNINFVYGIGKKNSLQKYYEKLNKYISMLKDYAIKIDKCGKNRNS